MKIALVHSYYSSRQSSGENVVVEAQAAALSAHGMDVKIVAAHTDDLERAPGYKVRSAVSVTTGRGASPLDSLRDFQPDLVHVHNLFPNWGTSWLKEWKKPLVATMHNFRPVCAAGTLFRDGNICTLCPDIGSLSAVKYGCYRGSRLATLPLAIKTSRGLSNDALVSRADRVILLSGRSRSLYGKFGLDSQKATVIPNFVDDEGFAPRARPGHRWVYVGRLSEEKGIVSLLKNWPEWAGLDVYGDGPLRSEVEGLCRDRVTYHGALSRAALPQTLAEASGLVFPSECFEGGIPLSYVEALAAGRAVVAKAGSSAADDVASSASGEVFGEWSGLEAALRRAELNLGQYGTAARKHYDASYQRGTFLDRTQSLYQELIEEYEAR